MQKVSRERGEGWEPAPAPSACCRMYTAAQLRLLARAHLKRASETTDLARRGMLQSMAAEFERDAKSADREERREAYLKGTAPVRSNVALAA